MSARTLVRPLALLLALAILAPESPALAQTPDPADVKPQIEWKKIPFGAKRKRQMAAYSERHYGERTWELVDPRVIVQHYTDGTSFDSAWNHFASNARHLGEKPGVCAQFLIDTDGTIHQLVNLKIRCRHAIGMNWTSIGIEHVGTRAGDILHSGPMIRASLRLTVWLMARYGISWGNVIGHAEILRSPYHHERYEDWRCRTHADWNRREMRTYRRKLKRTARRLDVPIGDPPVWVDNGC
ncbi:MAG TPA: peptidoglycan recognition family protein [Actinomycetota bacterium]|nr:peptidoglycan recognition family protein [Actinomycetota bacterium]